MQDTQQDDQTMPTPSQNEQGIDNGTHGKACESEREGDEPTAPTQMGDEPLLMDASSKSVADALKGCMASVMATKVSPGEVAKYLNKVGQRINDLGGGPNDPLIQMYKDCVESNGGAFNVRNDAMGRKWAKELQMDKELRDDYSKMQGYKQKEEFRKHWAQKNTMS